MDGIGDLDATATLALAEREVSARRRQGVDRLLLLQHWADLHSEDPQARPGAVPVSKGGDRLIQLCGEGTPKASELGWAELAIALETGAIALRNQAGQALDLRHRLPRLWALVKDLRIEPWYTVDQLGLGAYRWITRHGLARIVTPRGTRKIELIRARDGTILGEIYPGPAIHLDYHSQA